MTAALKSRNDDRPDRPSLTLSYSKTPVSPPPADRSARRRQRRHKMGGAAWQRREVRWQPKVMPRRPLARPSAAPARAVVMTSLIQLVAIAMNLRLRHRRSLRAIERNLADSDPSLTKLFSTFTVLAQGEERCQRPS